MIVYKATNTLNKDFYIGITKLSLKRRKRGHLYSLKYKSNLYFHNALRKYGPENFKWEIIDSSAKTVEELKQLEIDYIAKLKPEYNMTSGGDGVINPSPEAKEKSRKALKGRTAWNKGKKMDKDFCNKVSKAQVGKKRKPHTDEHKKKISLAKKGKKRSQKDKEAISKAMKGIKYPNRKPTSDETKDKIRKTVLAKKQAKKLLQLRQEKKQKSLPQKIH